MKNFTLALISFLQITTIKAQSSNCEIYTKVIQSIKTKEENIDTVWIASKSDSILTAKKVNGKVSVFFYLDSTYSSWNNKIEWFSHYLEDTTFIGKELSNDTTKHCPFSYFMYKKFTDFDGINNMTEHENLKKKGIVVIIDSI